MSPEIALWMRNPNRVTNAARKATSYVFGVLGLRNLVELRYLSPGSVPRTPSVVPEEAAAAEVVDTPLEVRVTPSVIDAARQATSLDLALRAVVAVVINTEVVVVVVATVILGDSKRLGE
jgi:hypothetical protein